MQRARDTARRTQGLLGGRSDQVVRRVLDAATAELARAGYQGLRIDDVATRAGVNKTTVYRRWPTRRALVAAVVERMCAPLRAQPLPDTGELERDLLEAFTRRSAFSRKVEGRAWARLLDERRSPEVEALIGSAVDARRDAWRAMVQRGAERGEIPAQTDAALLLELVRALVEARPAADGVDEAWLRVAVCTVLAGARAGTLTAPPPKRAPRTPRQ